MEVLFVRIELVAQRMMGGATGGGMQRIDWNGNVLWDYTWSDPNHQQHHECIPMIKEMGITMC